MERDRLTQKIRQQEESAIALQHALEEDRDQALARADAAAQARGLLLPTSNPRPHMRARACAYIDTMTTRM